ncbi:hypothetical protein C900_04717 [Fulvivirga imtechensis AK7]|uniref:Uncharacterized protein n=1 Tax=Fulvivirga imtechensis AK7 TaxID=1237149 RepID=L8JLT0_9BACT|nr:hypothetical protein C900_04717 [Fulvivirga imtechensis AK7]
MEYFEKHKIIICPQKKTLFAWSKIISYKFQRYYKSYV